MNIFNEYSQPTIDFIWKLLAEAYKDEDKLDKILEDIADDVFKEVCKILKDLEKSGRIDLNKKIRLGDHPAIYKALKDIENQQWHRFTEWCWIGNQVIAESLTRTYRDTLLWTYDTFRPKIPSAPTEKSLDVQIKITDTYIYNHYLKIPWCQDGKVYSDRLWGNVANFQSKLSYVLEQGIARGKGVDWMMEAWRKLTKTAGYEVARLLKTETMAMWSEATKEAYLDMGIEYVEIINPEPCDEVCSDYVGEIIPLEEAIIGDELPPYHPNCVCDFHAWREDVSADEYKAHKEEYDEED